MIYYHHDGNDWVVASKDTFVYVNDTVAVINLQWKNEEWVNYEMILQIYNAGRMAERTILDWVPNEDTSEYSWVFTTRSLMEYDKSGKLTLRKTQVWSPIGWGESSQETSQYNPNGNLIYWLVQSYSNNNFVNRYKKINTYKVISSAGDEHLSDEINIRIYPSPARDEARVEYYMPADGVVSINIYDLSGKKLIDGLNKISAQGINYVTVNLNGLSSGAYICEVRAKGIRKSVKFNVNK